MSISDDGPVERQSFLTPHEVSDLLRISVHTVRRWIKDGSLPAYKVGRAWRVRKHELESWLAQHKPVAPVGDEANRTLPA